MSKILVDLNLANLTFKVIFSGTCGLFSMRLLFLGLSLQNSLRSPCSCGSVMAAGVSFSVSKNSNPATLPERMTLNGRLANLSQVRLLIFME